MTDGTEIELRTWAEEIYRRLVWYFTQLMNNTGMSHDEASEILRPMIEYLSSLDKELVCAG